jgi:lipopolysaccharide export system permease protein
VTLLDRYIFKSVLFTCTAAVALFAFVVALPNVVRDLLSPLLAGQFDLPTFARLVALLIPFAISFALPMGILTGVLLTLGRLSADSEITAMRAAGISVVRVARPVFILAAVGALVAVYVNLQSMPWARVQFHREFASAVRANPLGIIVPKTFIRDFKGVVLYVGAKEGDVLRDIWLWDLDSESRVRRLVRAESGAIVYDEATNSLVPTLTRATIEERDPQQPENFAKSPRVAAVGRFEEIRIPLDRYLGQSSVRMKQEWLTAEELSAARERHAAQVPVPEKRAAHAREQMTFSLIAQERLNLSLAVFSFALIGVPLGIKVSRRETSANLGLALLLVLTYYILTVAVKSLDKHPHLRPDLLIWLPNLLFLGLGVWLFTRIERN